MKKRIIAVLLMAAMTASLAVGCGKSSSGGSSDSKDDITITLLNKYPEEEYRPYFEEAIADYEEANPGIHIDMENASDEEIKDKLSTLSASDDLPDIFFSWSGEYCKKFARSGQTLDLTSYLEEDSDWKDSFLEAFLNDSTFDGKTYGIPYRSSVIYMVYNKAVFEELKLEVPETYEEFLNVCEALKENNVTPVGFGNSATWYSAWWIGQFNAMEVSADTLNNDYNPANGGYTDAGYEKAIQDFLDLNEAGYFGDNVNSKDYYEVREQFMAGLCGMMLDATAQFSIYEDGMGDDFGYFKFPVKEDGAGDPGMITGGTEVYCVSSKCEYPDEAIDFLKYMTSVEQAIKQTEQAGLPNCVIGGITEENASENLVDAYEQAEDYTNIADWLDTAVDASIANAYMETTQEALAGDKSAADVMAAVRTAAEEVAASYTE